MALAGGALRICPAAIAWAAGEIEAENTRQLEAWLPVQRGHAVANGLPVVTANRVGFEGSPNGESGQTFWGNSFAVGPQGEFLGRASADREELLLVDLDLARSEEVRRIWPFLRDRRIDAYGDLTRRFRD
jgi:N-carbamoylputrescine amidase